MIRLSKFAVLSVASIAALSLTAVDAEAQLGRLLGTPHGSYCRFRSGNRLRVNTHLPFTGGNYDIRLMTLRRLADMTASRGFSAFVLNRYTCGTNTIDQRAISYQCIAHATMIESRSAALEIRENEQLFDVVEIFAQTQRDAPNYPRLSGLMDRGNQCVLS